MVTKHVAIEDVTEVKNSNSYFYNVHTGIEKIKFLYENLWHVYGMEQDHKSVGQIKQRNTSSEYYFFVVVGPPKESIFLTTIYGLDFSQHYTYI